jgi:hypothetical protein
MTWRRGLKSLKEHMEDVKLRVMMQRERLTGIACPYCGHELRYVGDTAMMSNPPQRKVECSDCDYRSRIYV